MRAPGDQYDLFWTDVPLNKCIFKIKCMSSELPILQFQVQIKVEFILPTMSIPEKFCAGVGWYHERLWEATRNRQRSQAMRSY